jgi:UDP-N-acetylmuramoyl-tripeptide--D-alanyl-D-alanine ligase
MRIEDLYQIYLKHPAVITDSRKIEVGCMFFALKGPNFDANSFAIPSLEAGAAWAVVDDLALATHPQCIVMPDVLTALQALAQHHRKQWSIPVLAITGTNGKTTTKELVAAVLQSTYPVHYTKGNLNNHIGVPLTILACPTNTEVAVIEMGANKPGDIMELCQIAQPTHGLVTNIGKAHLQGLGDLNGVKRTKSELYRYLAQHNGLAFVHRDERYLTALSKSVKRRIFYGPRTAEHPNEGQLVAIQPALRIAFGGTEIQTQITGTFNLPNVLTAIAVGNYFKVGTGGIKQSLEQYIPSMNRSQVVQWRGAEVFMDAYNANPSSMSAALTHFAAMQAQKKVIVIGDMFELGDDALPEHKKIYTQATKSGADVVITAGTIFGQVKHRKTDLHFADTESLKAWFQSQVWQDNLILLKGSRGMQLEKLLV